QQTFAHRALLEAELILERAAMLRVLDRRRVAADEALVRGGLGAIADRLEHLGRERGALGAQVLGELRRDRVGVLPRLRRGGGGVHEGGPEALAARDVGAGELRIEEEIRRLEGLLGDALEQRAKRAGGIALGERPTFDVRSERIAARFVRGPGAAV